MKSPAEHQKLIKQFRKHDFYKRYIGNINIDNFEYIKLNYKDSSAAGLSDTVNQLKDYLGLAYLLNLSLIDPERALAPIHDDFRKQKFIFGDYFNVESIKVRDQRVDLIQEKNVLDLNSVLTLEGLVYPVHNEFTKLNFFDLRKTIRSKNMSASFEPAEKYKTFATNFVSRNKIEGCIHIRRGDRLNVGCRSIGISAEEMDYATRTENILDFLSAKNAPTKIYVMTDMKEDDPIIQELRDSKEYKFLFIYDFEELLLLKKENNYKAFHQETCIKDHKLVGFKSEKFDPVFFLKDKL